jgi:hypothetical protein
MIDAGGLGSYANLPAAERSTLFAKHGIRSETIGQPADAAPKPSEAESGGPALEATQYGGYAPALALECVQYLSPSVRHPIDDVEYIVGNHRHAVDRQGRPSYGLANFTSGQIPYADRNECSRSVGYWGVPPSGTPWPTDGYVGGHLIAASLGGTPARINLTPQANKINASTFQRIEDGVRYCARWPQWRTTYMVIPQYGNSPLTPESYSVSVALRRPWPSNNNYWKAIDFGNWTGNVPPVPFYFPLTLSGNLEQINLFVDLFVQQMRDRCSSLW